VVKVTKMWLEIITNKNYVYIHITVMKVMMKCFFLMMRTLNSPSSRQEYRRHRKTVLTCPVTLCRCSDEGQSTER